MVGSSIPQGNGGDSDPQPVGPAPVATEVLVATRRSLHAVAEHVLAPARHAHTGRIGLRVVPGGVGTPTFHTAAGPTVVSMVGTGDGVDVVVRVGDGERRAVLRTVGEAAELVGVKPGAPTDVYTPVTSLDPDLPLALDAVAAGYLFASLAFADGVLRQLGAELVAEAPTSLQLWPEHFDLGFSAGEVNFGGSPGDEDHPLPYLYVGPWSVPDGPFWNEPFGASTPMAVAGGGQDAVAFLRSGHDAAAQAR